MTRQYVGTPTNVYRGWRIEYNPPPIPSRNCDWSGTHPDFDGPDDNRQVWAASYDALTAEIDAWISENTTYGLIDPEQDRKDAIMQVVGLCNRIPGATTWNAAEFMYDLMAKRLSQARAAIAKATTA